jgi:hypothetical protein
MFENRRVYLLTGVAYMGAMLFGSSNPSFKQTPPRKRKESPTDKDI